MVTGHQREHQWVVVPVLAQGHRLVGLHAARAECHCPSSQYAPEKVSQLRHAPGSLCAPAPSFTRCTWNLKPPTEKAGVAVAARLTSDWQLNSVFLHAFNETAPSWTVNRRPAMIPSTMDRDKFKTNIGRTIQFIPHPRRDSANGSWESDMNTWILQDETADKKGFTFLNAIRDHDPLVLDLVQIRHFDAPDKLVLRGQAIFKDNSVLFEPFHPRPASLAIPNTNLNLLLEGADENGVRELPGPTVDSFRFYVANRSQQTVRDCRAAILVPQTFTRPPYGSYEGDLPKPHATSIGERKYAVYEKSMSQPIYKNDSIKIGKVLLSTVLGDHIILWQIRCDDGVFPSEAQYGEIKVRIVPSRR